MRCCNEGFQGAVPGPRRTITFSCGAGDIVVRPGSGSAPDQEPLFTEARSRGGISAPASACLALLRLSSEARTGLGDPTLPTGRSLGGSLPLCTGVCVSCPLHTHFGTPPRSAGIGLVRHLGSLVLLAALPTPPFTSSKLIPKSEFCLKKEDHSAVRARRSARALRNERRSVKDGVRALGLRTQACSQVLS